MNNLELGENSIHAKINKLVPLCEWKYVEMRRRLVDEYARTGAPVFLDAFGAAIRAKHKLPELLNY